MSSHPDVLIVGGGVAGLCCALRLNQQGISSQVLEASDTVGGRVRTDEVEGFLLDRGFQVLLTAYPEARSVLDYDALDLRPFYPGALIRCENRFHRFADPWRHPIDGLLGLFSPVGSLSDKLLVAKLRRQVLSGAVEDLYRRPETTTINALRTVGFSEHMIDRFFKPFIGGVFFDPDLGVSSRMFEFGFRMFSIGDTALPSRGMGAIPEQIAGRLPAGCVRTGARVASIQHDGVRLDSGEEIQSQAIVVATEGPEAARLLGDQEKPGSRSVTCLYFVMDEPLLSHPLLVMNGEGKGPINSLCSPSSVAPGYAPRNRSLLEVTIIGSPDQDDKQLEAAVRAQLTDWFGQPARGVRHLRTYRILHALPMQTPPTSAPGSTSRQVGPRLFVCGEYQSVASLQWAMVSGRQAAEAVAEALSR